MRRRKEIDEMIHKLSQGELDENDMVMMPKHLKVDIMSAALKTNKKTPVAKYPLWENISFRFRFGLSLAGVLIILIFCYKSNITGTVTIHETTQYVDHPTDESAVGTKGPGDEFFAIFKHKVKEIVHDISYEVEKRIH